MKMTHTQVRLPVAVKAKLMRQVLSRREIVYWSADILGRWGHFLSSKAHFRISVQIEACIRMERGCRTKRSGEGNAKCHFRGRGSPRMGETEGGRICVVSRASSPCFVAISLQTGICRITADACGPSRLEPAALSP